MQYTLCVLSVVAVLLQISESAPTNDTVASTLEGTGPIEIPAGELNFTANDTIEVPADPTGSDVAGGSQGAGSQGDVVAPGQQSDVVTSDLGDPLGTEGQTALGGVSTSDIATDLATAKRPPAHTIDTPGSSVTTSADVIQENTDPVYPGPYVSLEEANADNKKVYLDPEICKQCNPDITVRNSCFLKHPLDCRKYIHCINRKDKWTAYNMRCSFGTFWSDQHNTCQFSHMVDCSTDLCRNPDLKSYNSDVNDNCRAFWSCDRSHSMPVCCEKYFTFRDGVCIPDTNCTTECLDPCINTDIASYVDELNCRHFYECRDKKSVSFCCPKGQAFTNGSCTDEALCDMQCPADAVVLRLDFAQTTPQTRLIPSCSLEAVGKGKFQFIGNRNKNHVMSCAGSLVFSVEKCTCDFPTKDVMDALPRECKPEVCIDFEQGSNPVKVENHNHVDISGGLGHFNGDSFLAIPLYSYNERFSKKINIKMLFKSEPGRGQDRQVLVSNCRTTISAGSSRLSPSLAIIIDKSLGQNYVIFLGTTKNNGNASIAHTFQPAQWTSLELIYDGQRLTASTNTIDYDTGKSIESHFDTKELAGKLKVGLESLKIGKCLDRDGFHGEMDDICIGDCLNGKHSG